MEHTLLETAFSGLMHDIGKFYQRTKPKSDLDADEEKLTPINEKGGYHTHLHSGYTSRFFREYLKQYYNEFEYLTSAHHLSLNDEFAQIIKRADQIASAIDRKDEQSDYEEKNKKGKFQTVRLSSVIGEVDFGKPVKTGKFALDSFSQSEYPKADYAEKDKEDSVYEYHLLWKRFIEDFQCESSFDESVDKYCFDRLYALMYEYTTLVPASTYEGNTTFVSLFDHLKLTSAIASCLYLNDSNDEQFIMFEFDVSGIQKFIFKVTEGKDTKRDVAKSLRGRSFLISAITNIITYSYLNEFGLTQSNIIFNTGGGALLLLPKCNDFEERIEKVSKVISSALFELFNTDITYVYSFVDCDARELENFKTDKATNLKTLLEEEKSKKFHKIIKDDFFFKETDKNHVCKMCGTNLVEHEDESCEICQKIIELSNFFVKHEKMYMVYDFNQGFLDKSMDSVCIDLGYMQLHLIDEKEYQTVIENKYDYIESLNHSRLGNTRWIANLVPQKNGQIKSFEQITKDLIDPSYGDPKLGILKMDVDNLGAIFAFGLDNARSLSKFLTLSRLMEVFFGHHLVEICKDVSEKLNSQISVQSDNESMFYINYAGGDDLVIVGPIAGIIELSNQINKSFREYTLNENITISGGITVQSATAPIRFGIQEAEEYLEQSKKADDKNSITLLNTTCKMSKFDEVLQKANRFKSYIDGEKISRTNFYHLMTILDTDVQGTYLRSIPKIMYSLKRNVADDVVRNDLIEEITTKDIPSLKVLVLEMKLAIMQTRR